MVLKVFSCSILTSLFWAAAVSRAAEPSRPKQLLLDTRVVDRVTNAQLVVGTVRKHPTIEPDRGTGYRTDGDRPGAIVTNPVVCRGKELAITADASRGSIRVTVFQEDGGEVIRSEPITGDVTDRVIADLTPFVGKPVRLSFELKQATLYSFSFPFSLAGAAAEPDGLDQAQASALTDDEAPSGLIPVGSRK
ncbi:MAG: hypothetical protein FJ275_11590, partial [Planctomycetes bacterium]|nr:hypothetical protein [Planctomycetota bacterium]